ncbi:hypothetical protein CVT25_001636 [Psilocybe cyanescens]|uniref:Carboxylic ester hydrolase n=1 Tax=Psilocybe cyanescens TaxID=93625 RepID=A0A409WQ72_PSICY|nr:hypothetical protein CVT25_001636 [Psilocybe cyanescens]
MVYALRHSWILILACHSFATFVATPPIVNLGYAQYQGTLLQDKVTNATHTQFLGLRYAAPPTGSNRFRAPAPPATTPGIQQANVQPPECFQATIGNSPTTPFRVAQKKSARAVAPETSEDCLFLNVHVPGNLGQKRNLPVVVWIHGGGYIEGSAPSNGGNDLVRESGENVVAVAIQYRLGVFGFLAGQKVKNDGSLNAGLLDQQFALKWVQQYIGQFGGDPNKVTIWGQSAGAGSVLQHIGQFGGDPNKVTIWGQSAGAGSVLQHVIANGGMTQPPLFRAAMTSSTFLPSQYMFNDSIPETVFNETVSQTKCSSATDAMDCLRKVNVDTLQKANKAVSLRTFFGTFVFVPVIDGTFITDRPTVLLKERKVNGQIVLSVTNSFEGTTFVNQRTADTVRVPTYIAELFPKFTSQQAHAAAAHYAGLGSNIFQARAIIGESILICPTYFLLRAFGGLGFKGEFAVPPGTHGMESAFYFNNGALPAAFPNLKFVNAFSESFQNFGISLDPNVKTDPTNITPPWKLWNGTNEMLFDRTKAGAPDIRAFKTSDALVERCNFWESMGAATSQ